MADIVSHWHFVLIFVLVIGGLGVVILKSPYADSHNGAFAGAFIGGCAGLVFVGAALISLLMLALAFTIRLF